MKEETHYIELPDRKLHLYRISGNLSGPSVFCVHGAIENGRIFYSKNKKGLAYYLASHGYDVFIVDLGGRGNSTPYVSSRKSYSQFDNICLEIPECIKYINKLKNDAPMHWLGHSWGGVILASVYARYEDICNNLRSCVFLASKRQIKVFNLHKIFIIDIVWKFIGKILISIYGYLPAKKYLSGSDDEPKDFYLQCNNWVQSDEWIDIDGFDYKKRFLSVPLAPTLFLTGSKDHSLGHQDDVKRLLKECGKGMHKFKLLSISNGAKANYGHIDILTSKLAVNDHFREISQWIKEHA